MLDEILRLLPDWALIVALAVCGGSYVALLLTARTRASRLLYLCAAGVIAVTVLCLTVLWRRPIRALEYAAGAFLTTAFGTIIALTVRGIMTRRPFSGGRKFTTAELRRIEEQKREWEEKKRRIHEEMERHPVKRNYVALWDYGQLITDEEVEGYEKLSPPIRAIVEAEIKAGNRISRITVQQGTRVTVQLSRGFLVKHQVSGDIVFDDVRISPHEWCGEYTDRNSGHRVTE
ncbi:MAG TPA: hypothetical protein VFD58_17755 [Blastocatellia bacterium]|nr:hypothetical protein [Blastocatellia bacterium]